MQKILLPYSATGYFSGTVIDYLAGDEKIQAFMQYLPSLTSIPVAIENRKKFALNRVKLINALKRQHQNHEHSTFSRQVEAQIDGLRLENVFTVTTAHQPNLFLGPLYLIYKIISTINLAGTLNKQFPSNHFIPVFWMGSEDHDQHELNHIHLFKKKIAWQSGQQGAVGRMKTESLDTVINEVKSILGESENAKWIDTLLKKCYLNSGTIAEATRKLIYHFFAADGLLVIDGDDPVLKREFLPVLQRELLQRVSVKVLSESDKEFARMYELQIKPRDLNLFYLDDQKRERIISENEQFRVNNSELIFSKSEMEELLQQHPEKFSPNVVLRPLYQEFVLPNVAFIGGGSEVSYYLQLKRLFTELKIHFPVVFLRNSAMWIDQIQSEKMNKLGINESDLFLETEKLVADYITRQAGVTISLSEEREMLSNAFESAKQKAVRLDESLRTSYEAEQVKMSKLLDGMEDRLRRAARRNEETSLTQIKGLKEKLFPGGELQERYDNWMQYYLQHGEFFFSALRSCLDPSVNEFTILKQ